MSANNSNEERAFPTIDVRGNMRDGDGFVETVLHDGGLTKRELFAAMAMQGMLGGTPGSHLVPPNCAKQSVEYADALLSALKDAQP